MQNREQKVHEKQLISLFIINMCFSVAAKYKRNYLEEEKLAKAITAKANEKTEIGKLSAFNLKGSRVIRPAVKGPLPETKGGWFYILLSSQGAFLYSNDKRDVTICSLL